MLALITIEVLGILLVAVSTAAVLTTILWLRARRRSAAPAGTDKTPFKPDTLYRVRALAPIADHQVGRYHGVMEKEDGEVFAFMSSDLFNDVAPGDCVALVRGRLIKVDGSGFSGKRLVSGPPVPLERAKPEPPTTSDETRFELDSPSPRSNETFIAAKSLQSAPPEADATVPYDGPGKVFGPDPEEADETLRPSPSEDERTRMVAPGSAVSEEHQRRSQFPYLEVIEGPDKGIRFTLPFGHSTLGRDPNMTINLSDDAASRLHCEVVYQHHGFMLRDAGSTNGTWCNGVRISEHELNFGDSIKVAESELVFSCKGHELKTKDPAGAIRAFEACIAQGPDFLAALKELAFLLERDVARRADAGPVWKRIAELDSRS